jgi:hypothetical protein
LQSQQNTERRIVVEMTVREGNKEKISKLVDELRARDLQKEVIIQINILEGKIAELQNS